MQNKTRNENYNPIEFKKIIKIFLSIFSNLYFKIWSLWINIKQLTNQSITLSGNFLK